MSGHGEAIRRFACFGADVGVYASGAPCEGPPGAAAVALAAARLRDVHLTLSRFIADSELTRLNADPRETVPASPLMLRFVASVKEAGELSGGLVDATRLDAIEQAGYRRSRAGAEPLALHEALAAAPARRPAAPDPAARWREVHADPPAGTVTRPPGVRLDSGGLGKGLAADLAAPLLATQATFAVDCAGDLRIGGAARRPRNVDIEDPFGGEPVHRFGIIAAAVATSGIGRRSWLDAGGRPAHHVLDPGRGVPAYTGVVQASALAPTALEAEALAKAALLSGPVEGPSRLVHGGVLVLDDGSVEVVSVAEPARSAA